MTRRPSAKVASLVSYLEDLVARLKLQQDAQTPDGDPVPVPQWNGVEAASSQTAAAYSLAATVASNSAPVSSTSCAPRHALPYYRGFFKGAELPFPLAFQIPRPINLPYTDGEANHAPLPPDVADKLMAVYADRILPQYPLFSRQEIDEIFSHFKAEIGTSSEQFITYMALAVATLSSRTRNYRKLVSVAESLRSVAFSCLDFGLGCHHATTTTIQHLLLLAQYGFLLPSSANLWQIVGEASRIAVELGLHRETPVHSGLNEESIEGRKRIYWTLYVIERSVAITSHRPFGVGRDQIHVSLPHLQEDPNLAEGSPDHPADLSIVEIPYLRFTDRLQFLRLQAEICSINIGMRSIPDCHLTYQDWSTDIERRVSGLKSHGATLKWCAFMECRIILLLHMPCSRNPSPNERSVIKYFDSALHIVNLHWELLDAGSLTYTWHAAHHCYEAGNLILYALWYHHELIHLRFTTAQVFEAVHQITGAFILLEKRWPAVRQCAMLFDRLHKQALSFFAEEEPSDPESILEARQVKDLVFRENADFLYACEQPASTSTPEPALPTFDIDGLSFDDFIDFSGTLDFSIPVDLNDDIGLFGQAPEDDQIEVPDLIEQALIPEQQNQEPDTLGQESGPVIDKTQLETALQNLAICSPCKRRRIRCDRNLSACRNCVKYKRDCVYWDSALGEDISRKAIQELYDQVQTLMLNGSQFSASLEHVSDCLPQMTADPVHLGSEWMKSFPNILCLSLDSAASSLNMLFFGRASAFGRLVNGIGQSVSLRGDPISAPHPPALLESLCSSLMFTRGGRVAQAEAESLAWSYYQAVEIIYPILGRDLLSQTLSEVYNPGPTILDLKLAETRLNIVLAISFALLSIRDPRLQVIADAYFSEAISCGISSDYFVDQSISSLQLVLLLCVYAWIRPSSMDIWRLLGHASRMFLDLMEAYGSDKTANVHTGVLYRTLYTLETEISLAFGRPHQLPDGQELPAFSSDLNSMVASDLPTLRYNLVRHQNRFHRDLNCCGRRTSVGQTVLGPAIDTSAWMGTCVSDTNLWLEDWNTRVDVLVQGSPMFDTRVDDLKSAMRYYGEIKQCETLLLAKAASDRRGQVLVSSSEELTICKRLIHAACSLHGLSLKRTSGRVPSSWAVHLAFPLTWTFAHALFSAIVILLEHMQCNSTDDSEVSSIFRMGCDVLTSMERLTNSGYSGLVDCLKGLYEAVRPVAPGA
ncbi:fungal-specific transcription factor domain-containing protein [Aspergillus pseudoustus]|uniref:Fungal-specific transcription factor domain-containing protein n=1 Tax=Aspergillus pseudoustus TaxID=1810923 RepID=A0ABR4L1Z1_9EURO